MFRRYLIPIGFSISLTLACGCGVKGPPLPPVEETAEKSDPPVRKKPKDSTEEKNEAEGD